MTAFNNPFLLGFDEIEGMLDRITKSAESFPPYNIEQTSFDTLRITLAVAGYGASDLEMTLDDNQLMIRGRQNQDTEHHYLYRGIAARSFIKSVVRADGMTVMGASLENGLLAIDLKKPVKKSHVQHIEIKTRSQPVLIDTAKRKK
ncbi:MAG: Hsp20 family protein [Pseudomonadota bacterium]|nr:Hsp20 family protein [Pseudomonadota bacterium]